MIGHEKLKDIFHASDVKIFNNFHNEKIISFEIFRNFIALFEELKIVEIELKESSCASSSFAIVLYHKDDKRWALFFTLTREEEKKHLLVYENCIAIGVKNVENHYDTPYVTMAHDETKKR